jgi:hypothetical protein
LKNRTKEQDQQVMVIDNPVIPVMFESRLLVVTGFGDYKISVLASRAKEPMM